MHGRRGRFIAPLYLLFPQLRHELLEDMRMLINIILRVLDGDRPLVIKPWREEDTAIRQEKPVGIREANINIPPGAVVSRTLVAEHGTTLRANLCDVHRHIKLFNDADIGFGQLF